MATKTKKKTGSPKASRQDFSVRDAFAGKKIFVIGGTGFLGRLMLHMLVRHTDRLEKIYMLIRPTHGQTARDRFEREIIKSPVFDRLKDREDAVSRARELVVPVDGDASREGLNLGTVYSDDNDDPDQVFDVDLVLNTAGNVEFNPPLDLSLSANVTATKNALAFAKKTKGKRYVHISTCYVADRSIHKDIAPEEPVSDRVRGPDGTEVQIDPQREIEQSLAAVERIRESFTDEDFLERAAEEVKKTGKDDKSGKLRDRMAKNLRTFETREKLILEGKKRAERLNRPNVYTYTKTLAELLVQQASGELKTTIVRPSIVEASLKTPFPGWNEGVQGSAPLIYLMNRGHRFIPSLSSDPSRRRDAFLDLIPVDLVAAGTLLASAALLKDQAVPVYQLAAGDIEHRMTITRTLNISQVTLRDRTRSLDTGIVRWFKLNVQAVTVTKETFEKFSSPRTLKFLEKAKSRFDRFTDRLEGPASDVAGTFRSKVEKFWMISQLKNKIFQEFMPFINHGYPLFLNHNAVSLYRSLSDEEQEMFFFEPRKIDYIDYFANIHIPGILEWVFPVLDKRFAAIEKLDRSPGAGSMMQQLRTLFTSNPFDFRQQYENLRAVLTGTESAAQAGEAGNGRNHESRQNVKDRWLWHFLRMHSLEDLESADEQLLIQLSSHIEIMTGHRLPVARLRALKKTGRLIAETERLESAGDKPGLPKDGVIVPKYMADPTRDFLYRIQMYFYRRILKAEVTGTENIPYNNNRVIVVANHASHLDYGLVQYSLKKYGKHIGILAAKDYFFNDFWKSTFFNNFMTLIPVDRGARNYADAFSQAVMHLEKNAPLLIFPEGTRSSDGTIQSFRHGLGFLVKRTEADVLPVRLSGTFDALPRGKTIPRSRQVHCRIGKLIHFEELAKKTESMTPTKTYHTISEEIENRIRSQD